MNVIKLDAASGKANRIWLGIVGILALCAPPLYYHVVSKFSDSSTLSELTDVIRAVNVYRLPNATKSENKLEAYEITPVFANSMIFDQALLPGDGTIDTRWGAKLIIRHIDRRNVAIEVSAVPAGTCENLATNLIANSVEINWAAGGSGASYQFNENQRIDQVALDKACHVKGGASMRFMV